MVIMRVTDRGSQYTILVSLNLTLNRGLNTTGIIFRKLLCVWLFGWFDKYFWHGEQSYPSLCLNAQVEKDGKQSQCCDGGSPREKVHSRVSIGLAKQSEGVKGYTCIT